MGRQVTYGPRQLETAAGLARWQADRAADRGLIPPGAAGGRWTQAQVDAIRARAGEIRAAVGEHPGYGARRVAEALDAAAANGVGGRGGWERGVGFGGEGREAVATPDVELLAAWGLLDVVGVHRGRVLYHPAAVTGPDPGLVAAARRTAAQRAAVMGPSEAAGLLILDRRERRSWWRVRG